MPTNPHSLPNKSIVADQMVKVYEMKLAGKSHDFIAKALGISHGTVANRLSEAVRNRVEPVREEYRAYEVDRLDKMVDTVQQIIDNTSDPEVKLKAVDRLLRIQDRRAKLQGLDIQQVDVVVREGYSEQELELQALLAGAKQRNAVVEAELNGATTV